MNEQSSTARATRDGGACHGAVKLLVAALLAAAFVALAAPGRAEAAEIGFLGPDSDIGFADSDGYVPIYTDCSPVDIGGLYVPYYDGYTIQGSIIVNLCAPNLSGAGPGDLQRLVEHELGHSRGLLHSTDPNDIMYPLIATTGT
ncbi:MAG: matrixin family metalloprotease [Actinomycetota bacterium]|nr:matrixin family metalloprotease [Actinomycetota bacterium]